LQQDSPCPLGGGWTKPPLFGTVPGGARGNSLVLEYRAARLGNYFYGGNIVIRPVFQSLETLASPPPARLEWGDSLARTNYE